MRSAIAIAAIEALEAFGVTPETRHLVGALLPLWSRWPEMRCEDIEQVQDYFRSWGDPPREPYADRLSKVRQLAAEYARETLPAHRVRGLSEHGQGYIEGMRAMARTVLDVLDGDDA